MDEIFHFTKNQDSVHESSFESGFRAAESPLMRRTGAFNSSTVEQMQIQYAKDPTQRIFAPLAESYRKLSLLKEALEIAQRGVLLHPHFAAGRVTLAKVYVDHGQLNLAAAELKRAISLDPANLLAPQLLAEIFIEEKKFTDAAQLLAELSKIRPPMERVDFLQRQLKVLTANSPTEVEFLTDPDEESAWRPVSFSLNDLDFVESPATNVGTTAPTEKTAIDREAERAIAIAEAFWIRNDFINADKALLEAIRVLGPREDLISKREFIQSRNPQTEPVPTPGVVEFEANQLQETSATGSRREKLERILTRVRLKT